MTGSPRVTKADLQQLRWLGHQGHHRPVPVCRTAGDQLRHLPGESTYLHDGQPGPACVRAQQARHRRQPDLDPVRSPCAVEPLPPGNGRYAAYMDGNRPPFWLEEPEANAPFASSIVSTPGCRSVIPGLYVLGRNETLARTRASSGSSRSPKPAPSDRSPRRRSSAATGKRRLTDQDRRSALQAPAQDGVAGHSGRWEAGFPFSFRGGFCPASGESWMVRWSGFSSDARRPSPRRSPRLAARAMNKHPSARVWWGQDSGR